MLDGNYYQAPYPLKTGVRRLSGLEDRPRLRARQAEIGRQGHHPPYQRRASALSAAASAGLRRDQQSDDSIRYCARNGFIPTYFSKFESIDRQSLIYVEEAAKVGRQVRRGEKQNIVRWLHIADSEAQYNDKLRKYDVDIYKNFYGPFFPQFPTDPNTDFVENIKSSGIYTGGTVDEVRARWQQIFGVVPAEYITLIFHFAQQPKDDVIETLQKFMTKVVPHLDSVESSKAVAAE